MEPKIKVSKHMPDVFLQSKNVLPKDRQKKHSQKQQQSDKPLLDEKLPSNNQQNRKKQDREAGRQKKKNRNPFFNIRQYMRLSKEMDEKMREVRVELDKDRFSQFNLQNSEETSKDESKQHKQHKQHKEHKIKYEDCLTLNLIKKSQSSILKKILHVPTLTVYFLRQSLIDYSIDKSQLQQWIRKCNSPTSSSPSPQQIIQLYWNIPQSYYSIIYSYTDGLLFDILLQNTTILPMSFIQNIAITHIKADFQIYNSILIVKRGQQSQIKYLPVYQEIDDITPSYRMFRELLKINYVEENEDFRRVEKIIVGRLGFLMLVMMFGIVLVEEDVSNILFQTNQCCLFHKQMSNPNSLLKLYFDNNITSTTQKQQVSDILCKMLKFKPDQRANFSQLLKHKYFKTKFQSQITQTHELIRSLQSPGILSIRQKNSSYDIAKNKLNKLIHSMALILQGASEKDKKDVWNLLNNVQVGGQGGQGGQGGEVLANVRYILEELGFARGDLERLCGEAVVKLRRVYE